LEENLVSAGQPDPIALGWAAQHDPMLLDVAA